MTNRSLLRSFSTNTQFMLQAVSLYEASNNEIVLFIFDFGLRRGQLFVENII